MERRQKSRHELSLKDLDKEVIIEKYQQKEEKLKALSEKLDKEIEKNQSLELKYQALEKLYIEHVKKLNGFFSSLNLPVDNLNQVLDGEVLKLQQEKEILKKKQELESQETENDSSEGSEGSLEFDVDPQLHKNIMGLLKLRNPEVFQNRRSNGFWDSESPIQRSFLQDGLEERRKTIFQITSKDGDVLAEQEEIEENVDKSDFMLKTDTSEEEMTWQELMYKNNDEMPSSPIIPRYSDVDTKRLEVQNDLLAKKLGNSFINQSVNLSTDLSSKIRMGIELCFKSNMNLKDKQRIFKINDQNAKKQFEFRDYSPEIFTSLRKLASTDDVEFRKSICEGNWKVIITPGKSGAILFFTGNRKYLLKSVSETEMQFFQSILEKYHQHNQKCPSTTICRILGMYTLKENFVLNFIIMENIFPHPQDETFDLKGSSIGRDATEEEKKKHFYKDNDLLAKKTKIDMGKEFFFNFFQNLKEDCQFLASLDIMDYSLLLGVSSVVDNEKSNNIKTKYTCFKSVDGKKTYHLGIIDILQKWNLKKKAEMNIKSVLHVKNGLSSIPPKEYSQRFIDFIFNFSKVHNPRLSE